MLIFAGLLGVFAAYHTYYVARMHSIDAQDRPLVSGTTYVARDYSNGCMGYDWLYCGWANPWERFYYRTDLTPDELASRLEGWRIEKRETSNDGGVTLILQNQLGKRVRIEYTSEENENKTRSGYDLRYVRAGKGQYLLAIHSNSMYYLHPETLQPEVRQAIEASSSQN